MTVTVDRFLNAALDRELDPETATRECQAYFDLLKDRQFFRRTMTLRAEICHGQTEGDAAYHKAEAALTQVDASIARMETAYRLTD